MAAAPDTHGHLVLRAERWLRQSAGCSVVLRDPMRTHNQEQPDAIGWRDHVSILVEVKVSRDDFLADAKKPFRLQPEKGMGDWRLYLCPPELIQPDELPPGWGLLWATARTVRRIHGLPRGNWWGQPPLAGNKQAETVLLKSALRRLDRRGYLEEVYDQSWLGGAGEGTKAP